MPAEIKRMTRNDSAMLDAIENKHLAGDTVVVRLTHNGLELDFRAGSRAVWMSPPREVYARPDAKALISASECAAYFAWNDGKLVGQAVVEKHAYHLARLCDVRVALSERRRGVGARLVEAAERWAWQQGLAGVAVETQDNNPGACQFLVKCGYKFGGVDTLKMAALPDQINRPAQLRDAALTFYRFFT
ncbi:MAG: GNAT family N-acetyltransferase [Oscillospiraceae bacterium]|jgi:GNAT superfamily N-acetyltransferase|nr:GNAT family N-acetyltransferase [Oscillospiraceae bacterium]